MSKKRNNQNQFTVQEIDAPKASESSLSWFIQQNPREEDPDHIIRLISTLNARLLVSLGRGGESKQKAQEDALEFTRYFLGYDWKDPDSLTEAMINNWGDYPLILRVGMHELDKQIEQEMIDAERSYDKLGWPAQRSVDNLTAFIEQMNTVCCMSIGCMDNSSDQLVYDPNENDVIRENMIRHARCMFIRVIMADGGCTIRAGEDLDNENAPAIVYGLIFSGGHAKAIDKAEMKIAFETNPDGSRTFLPNIRYEKIPVILY